MRIALFSDIHANLPALRAVLASIDAHRPDQIFCLGDLVGYAPWPNEVVELLRRRNIPSIAGNYDEGVGNTSDDCGCAYKTDRDKKLGARSIAFTNEVITEDHRRWLKNLPRHIRLQVGPKAEYSILLVHGSPRRINEYLFEDRPARSLSRILDGAGSHVMAFGHTHLPYHRILETERDGAAKKVHAVNTGSSGKPKDGDPRVGWVLLEIEPESQDLRVEVDFVRVAYDVEEAARGVELSPLPDELAEMLRTGTS